MFLLHHRLIDMVIYGGSYLHLAPGCEEAQTMQEDSADDTKARKLPKFIRKRRMTDRILGNGDKIKAAGHDMYAR